MIQASLSDWGQCVGEVTADHRHIPVRMKSKVAVGNFIAELVEMVEGSTNEVKIVAGKTTEMTAVQESGK